MKIRVTLIIFMCTTFAANADKFPETKDLAKKSEPRHRVYEYSRSIEAVSVDFGNANGGGRSEVTKHVRLSYTPDEEDISDSMVGNHIQKGSERSLQVLTSTRKNSKQPSKNLHSDGSTSSEKVVSRRRKDKMDDFMMPLLVAYKMKFAALIPILMGGMSLLVSTTALAGFFFSLFAAVLGLKTD
ncbi:uncharacterized protein [Neodiprion pinetum]|uniref:uncharacterized protein n=1 Tax=Neodiprion pinetum TaxID=441929 RepID=UPI001EDECEC0|nr:uncharacterized protein LOC124220432 isoform X2 [Neodiprion pinetum]